MGYQFFKKVFTRKDTAEEFLQHYLPENVEYRGHPVEHVIYNTLFQPAQAKANRLLNLL